VTQTIRSVKRTKVCGYRPVFLNEDPATEQRNRSHRRPASAAEPYDLIGSPEARAAASYARSAAAPHVSEPPRVSSSHAKLESSPSLPRRTAALPLLHAGSLSRPASPGSVCCCRTESKAAAITSRPSHAPGSGSACHMPRFAHAPRRVEVARQQAVPAGLAGSRSGSWRSRRRRRLPQRPLPVPSSRSLAGSLARYAR
jgi:hypothetical protein